jgi:hypothetical protein
MAFCSSNYSYFKCVPLKNRPLLKVVKLPTFGPKTKLGKAQWLIMVTMCMAILGPKHHVVGTPPQSSKLG